MKAVMVPHAPAVIPSDAAVPRGRCLCAWSRRTIASPKIEGARRSCGIVRTGAKEGESLTWAVRKEIKTLSAILVKS